MTRRILIPIYTHNTWGGIEKWLEGLTDFLVRHSWDVVLGLARGHRFNNPETFRKRCPNLRTIELDGRTGTPEGRTRSVQRVVRDTVPDIVMPLGLADVYRAVGRLKREGFQTRLVAAIHAVNFELLADLCRFEPLFDACIGVNPIQAEYLASRGHSPNRVSAIVNGVEMGRLGRKFDLTSPAQHSDAPLRLLFIGRLNQHHKRVMDAVGLIEELDRRNLEFRMTFVGTGECEGTLRTALVRHTATGRVVFRGYMSHREIYEEVYPTHDAMIMFSPSLGEGCPLVIQEAMANGVVPICTEFVGIHSLGFLRHGQTGFIYPCGEIDRAADWFETLTNERDLLARMSDACQSAAQAFTIDAVHERWLAALNRIAEQPPRPLEVDLKSLGLGIPATNGRLDKWLSPGFADSIRRIFRRWPDHADGWAEWPGTLSAVDDATRAEMLDALIDLDKAAARNARSESLVVTS